MLEKVTKGNQSSCQRKKNKKPSEGEPLHSYSREREREREERERERSSCQQREISFSCLLSSLLSSLFSLEPLFSLRAILSLKYCGVLYHFLSLSPLALPLVSFFSWATSLISHLRLLYSQLSSCCF